jgi:hypothetical protein
MLLDSDSLGLEIAAELIISAIHAGMPGKPPRAEAIPQDDAV